MTELLYFVRVVAAALCGVVIGYERKNRAKEAGIRTHCIVACAAALMMITSKYAFFDLLDLGLDIKLDPSRVASTIVSGVGFLGAGMIFVQKQTIKGLTTAAGIWATAGIGMAIGAGMYIIGFLVTAFIVFAQIVLHRNNRFLSAPHTKRLHIKRVTEKGYQEKIMGLLKNMNIDIEEINVSYNSTDELFDYSMVIELPPMLNEEQLLSKIEYDTSIKSMR